MSHLNKFGLMMKWNCWKMGTAFVLRMEKDRVDRQAFQKGNKTLRMKDEQQEVAPNILDW